MILLDTLRPPSPSDPSASAYKDWLHLNFADPASGTIGLINASLNGSPWDYRARAIGTILVHSPELGWISYVENTNYSEANLGPLTIALRDVAVAIDERSGTLHASALGAANPFHARFSAVPVSQPVDLEQEIPLGTGWISWYVEPRMKLSGEWIVNGSRKRLTDVPCYRDHNWGRWHWGDNFGWEWAYFFGNPNEPHSPSFVFTRTTDRSHKHRGEPLLLVDSGSIRRRFSADNIALNFNGQYDLPLHRVPGAMAALHQQMAEPYLPRSVEIIAARASDRVTISFTARAAAQFIAADPTIRGYGYIHEIVGEYSCSGSLAGVTFDSKGFGVFEHTQ